MTSETRAHVRALLSLSCGVRIEFDSTVAIAHYPEATYAISIDDHIIERPATLDDALNYLDRLIQE